MEHIINLSIVPKKAQPKKQRKPISMPKKYRAAVYVPVLNKNKKHLSRSMPINHEASISGIGTRSPMVQKQEARGRKS